jgi:hypothetical protein
MGTGDGIVWPALLRKTHVVALLLDVGKNFTYRIFVPVYRQLIDDAFKTYHMFSFSESTQKT